MEGVTRVGLSGGVEVGIYKLEEIFEEVRKLGIDDSKALKEELFKRVKRNNWIPEDRDEEFAKAIFDAYKNFCRENE